VIELEARGAPAGGRDGGLEELAKLAAVDAGFEDLLLHIQIAR
jgi:hypothetical protein